MNKLTPILKELHDFLWEQHAELPGYHSGFDEEDLVYCTKIFMSALSEVMFANRDKNRDFNFHTAQAVHVGSTIHELVMQTTGYDLKSFYKNPSEDV